MSLTNYSDLVTALPSWLGRDDLTSLIPDFVTLFEACANRKLRVRQMETTTTLSPSSGAVSLPSDYLAWKRVTWAGDVNHELEYVHPSYFKAAYPDTPSDTPRIFTIEGSTLSVMPVSDTSLSFLYWAKVPSLQTNSTNWLMTAYPDLYLFGTLVEAQAYMVDAEKAVLWKARRDELFEEIKTLDQRTRGPSAPRIMGAVV